MVVTRKDIATRHPGDYEPVSFGEARRAVAMARRVRWAVRTAQRSDQRSVSRLFLLGGCHAEVLAAETADDPLEFWTHDGREADGAASRGLTVRGS